MAPQAAHTKAVLRAAATLRDACNHLPAPKAAAYTYNPLDYAWAMHAAYGDRHAVATGGIVVLGMNPGPFGMAQTGVPFGEVAAVRDWLGLNATVGRPQREHPKRPVLGLYCPRSEVSGKRLWGWLREHYGTPERCAAELFVLNYCPLLFMKDSGANLTPAELGGAAMQQIDAVCAEHLHAVLCALKPRMVIGVGVYAAERAQAVIAEHNLATLLGRVPHPSPANPAANAGGGWAVQATAAMRACGAWR